MLTEETQFRGKPILVFKSDDGKRILFSAGLNKLKLIQANPNSITAFIDKYNINKDNVNDSII